jgi:SnoaL-like domain
MNEKVIIKFYTDFQALDYRGMQEAYHIDAEFSDPVFGTLTAREVKAMWEMLLTRSKDLRISFRDVQASDSAGKCHWEAWYTFSKTGLPVHNIIDAQFEFKDGKIYRHHDVFSLWRWSRQALGTTGLLMGWSPWVQNKIRRSARKSLVAFSNQLTAGS